ncbi:MAG: AAA family ATPase [Candidatus Eisenbacteria bacterium]
MARPSNISKPKSTIGRPIPNAGEPTSAYFRSLTLKNIRCFGPEEQTLDLSDRNGAPAHWTVILGNNGTGKTTLLECLAGFGEARVEGGVTFSAMAWNYSHPDRHLIRQPIGATAFPGELHVGLSYGKQLSQQNGQWMPLERRSELLPEGGIRSETDLFFSLVFCCSYGASRRMGSTSLSIAGSSFLRMSPLADDSVELRNAEEWLLQLDYSASKDSPIQPSQKAHREQVRQLLIDILPDVTDIRFTSPTEESPRPGVEFKTPDGWLPLRYIGLGYRTTMAWMVDFASRLVERYPKSKDPLSEPAVCLVDEIDLHLHPRWQRTLMKHLSERFPNVQFIVTAHSPLFVQAAEDANLVVLRREKDRVRIDNDVERIKGWRVDQLLTSDLFELPSARPPRLDKLLEERRKLLTKGKLTAADRHRLEELSEQIGALPGGETAEDAKTRALLERALNELRRSGGKG